VPETSLLPGAAPGDVLVAVNAGPLWTPVFPLLSGIVLDAGSPADHAAITAREFGIPAVYATRNATLRIPDGAWVTVDGENGLVQWDNPSSLPNG
jgi:pyruvate,water dikinase